MKIAVWVKFDRSRFGECCPVDVQYADETEGGVPAHRMGYDFQGWFGSWEDAETYWELLKSPWSEPIP